MLRPKGWGISSSKQDSLGAADHRLPAAQLAALVVTQQNGHLFSSLCIHEVFFLPDQVRLQFKKTFLFIVFF